jgi:hypothetical protein
MEPSNPDKKTLTWLRGGTELQIKSLDDLFNVLAGIASENIDEEVGKNVSKSNTKLLGWLESNFPRQAELMVHMRSFFEQKDDFTPQQVREEILRDLRISLKKSS